MRDVSRRSLICYDGTDPAKLAVIAAGAVLGGAAVVVTVWEPVPPLDHARPLDAYLSVLGPAPAEIDAAAEDQARRIAAVGAEAARAAGVDAEPLAVRSRGRIASTLVAVADEQDADVIVIGARGHSSGGPKLVGDTANGVLHEARRPVLIVPPSE
jgi:nucleotide-binding universal stress UspA family protein